jgi:cell division protein FtsB
MAVRNTILYSLAALGLFVILLFALLGEKGLADLDLLIEEKDQLVKKNQDMLFENLSLSEKVKRLKNDPEYLEHIVKKELGVIGQDEMIITFHSKE